MNIKSTEIPGCYLLSKKPFLDFRGDFVKPYDINFLKEHNLDFPIAEVFYSNSHKNVLRGIHFQAPPYDHTKFITCLDGNILDVVLDLREGSPTFKKTLNFELSALDGQSVLIPRGCAHGFYTFSDNSLVAYFVETSHAPTHDCGILWSSLDFNWPCKNPLISERDSKFQTLAEFQSPFKK